MYIKKEKKTAIKISFPFFFFTIIAELDGNALAKKKVVIFFPTRNFF